MRPTSSSPPARALVSAIVALAVLTLGLFVIDRCAVTTHVRSGGGRVRTYWTDSPLTGRRDFVASRGRDALGADEVIVELEGPSVCIYQDDEVALVHDGALVRVLDALTLAVRGSFAALAAADDTLVVSRADRVLLAWANGVTGIAHDGSVAFTYRFEEPVRFESVGRQIHAHTTAGVYELGWSGPFLLEEER